MRYESMQLDEAGTLATVARFLGVDAPRRFLKSSTAVGEKRASDDLRDVVKNYDEIHKWLAPKGVLASPCLLKMLEVRGPQVFEPCPAPALVARTVTSLSPARRAARGGGTRGEVAHIRRTNVVDGRRDLLPSNTVFLLLNNSVGGTQLTDPRRSEAVRRPAPSPP